MTQYGCQGSKYFRKTSNTNRKSLQCAKRTGTVLDFRHTTKGSTGRGCPQLANQIHFLLDDLIMLWNLICTPFTYHIICWCDCLVCYQLSSARGHRPFTLCMSTNMITLRSVVWHASPCRTCKPWDSTCRQLKTRMCFGMQHYKHFATCLS